MAAAFGSCGPHADPVYRFGVYNDSDQAVIVRFRSGDQGYFVAPGEAGTAGGRIGEVAGPILILDERCPLQQSIHVTTQRGALRIAANRVAALEPIDTMPTGDLRQTELCPPA